MQDILLLNYSYWCLQLLSSDRLLRRNLPKSTWSYTRCCRTKSGQLLSMAPSKAPFEKIKLKFVTRNGILQSCYRRTSKELSSVVNVLYYFKLREFPMINYFSGYKYTLQLYIYSIWIYQATSSCTCWSIKWRHKRASSYWNDSIARC